MARLPAKSHSKRIQRQHVRQVRTKHGKRPVIVNKGVRKHPKPLGESYKRREEPKGKKGVPLPPQPKVRLRARVKPTRGEKQQVDNWVENMVAALTFKLIAHKGWESAYPPFLRDSVHMARMLQLMKDPQEFRELATDEEALGYLSTASLAGPPVHEWVDIMMYLFNKVVPKDKIPKDLSAPRELDSRRLGMLRDLKRWIRRQQWKEFKSRK